jgi:hypothetical protein
MKFFSIAAATASVVILGGCGGSAANTANMSSTANTAEGFWTGTTTAGYASVLLNLEDGQTFGMSVTNGEIRTGLYGAVLGNGSSVRGGSGTDLDFAAHTAWPVTYAGTVVAKKTLTLATSSNVTFTGVYSPAYDVALPVAQLVGSYSGTGIAGFLSASQPMSMTVASNGAITITSTDCIATANAVARSGGKNVFNFRIGFSGAGCGLGDGATTIGELVLDQSVVPPRAYLMSVRDDASDGFFWTGS